MAKNTGLIYRGQAQFVSVGPSGMGKRVGCLRVSLGGALEVNSEKDVLMKKLKESHRRCGSASCVVGAFLYDTEYALVRGALSSHIVLVCIVRPVWDDSSPVVEVAKSELGHGRLPANTHLRAHTSRTG